MNWITGLWKRKATFTRLLAGGSLLFLALNLGDPQLIAYANIADNEVVAGFAAMFAILIKICTFFALVTVGTVGKFIGTEYIAGELTIDIIRPLWVIVRNLVNISAVLILIFIALANLFTVGSASSWTIKEKLPKLLLALVAINFSMVACKVVLDAVYVGTVAIFSVSDQALDNKSMKEVLEGPNCLDQSGDSDCSRVKGKLSNFIDDVNEVLCNSYDGTEGSASGDDCFLYFDKESFQAINPGKAAEQGRAGENLFAAFANYVMYLENLPRLNLDATGEFGDGSANVLQALDSTIFSMIMGLLYSIGFIAILVALIARTIFMWFVIILSPGIVGAQIMGFNIGSFWDKIVAQMIMPLKIAAVLVVSFIMIGHLTEVTTTAGEAAQNHDFIVLGPALNKLGADVFGIVWKIATIVVFWMGLWWAIDDNLAKGITEKVKGGAELVGQTALNGLKSIPLLPAPGGGKNVGVGAYMNLIPMMKEQSEKTLREQQTRAFEPLTGKTAADQHRIESAISTIQSSGLDQQRSPNREATANVISTGHVLMELNDHKVREVLIKKLEPSLGAEKAKKVGELLAAKVRGGQNTVERERVVKEVFKEVGLDLGSFDLKTGAQSTPGAEVSSGGGSGENSNSKPTYTPPTRHSFDGVDANLQIIKASDGKISIKIQDPGDTNAAGVLHSSLGNKNNVTRYAREILKGHPDIPDLGTSEWKYDENGKAIIRKIN